jgi:hypothetical protein
MTDFEKTKLEIALKDFTLRNFEKPQECRNIDQIRFYVRELCLKIEEYEARFHYVPEWAYSLLSQYNLVQNSLLSRDFQRA